MADAERPPWLPLGSLLVREGLITLEQLELALLDQEHARRRLGEILVDLGWVTSRDIAWALSQQYEMDFVDLAQGKIDEELARLLPAELARRYQALPVRLLPGGVLLMAIADPTDVGACDELRAAMPAPIRLAVADWIELQRAIAEIHGPRLPRA